MLCRSTPSATLGRPASRCGAARVQLLGGVRRGWHAAPVIISDRAVVRVFAAQDRPSGGRLQAHPIAPEATATHVKPSNAPAVDKSADASSFVPVAAPLLTAPASEQPAASILGNQTLLVGLLILQVCSDTTSCRCIVLRPDHPDAPVARKRITPTSKCLAPAEFASPCRPYLLPPYRLLL